MVGRRRGAAGAFRLAASPLGSPRSNRRRRWRQELLGWRGCTGSCVRRVRRGGCYFTRSPPHDAVGALDGTENGTSAQDPRPATTKRWRELKLVTPLKLQSSMGAGCRSTAGSTPPLDLDPSKRYPLILYISWRSREYDGEFFDTGLENQLLPAMGWAVLRRQLPRQHVLRRGIRTRGVGRLARTRVRRS
jgi:hypothetical protein